MIEILEDKSLNLSHKVVHSGVLLTSIDVDFRGGNDCSRILHAPKLCLVLPRIGYLLSLADTIQDYYSSIDKEFLKIIENNFSWFEFDGSIINSQFPVGLLFDKHCKNHNSILFNIKLVLQSKNGMRTTIHYDKGSIFNNNLTKIITNNIKLSQTIMFGDCRRFQKLSKREYQELINSIFSLSRTTGNYENVILRLFGPTQEMFTKIK
ncbi:hypothetical protein OJ253_1272 [Cryptosporidium canis]|uniref:Autophagy protein ATG5 UblA domain-containing protein n=1 Tax=Cryptosporidium canis TaxID=195482 RepID=A0A9D5DNY3_9CRYT|nr:hypothetical protein OJ253_1272 [Cryptosporidium canis]